MRIAILTNVAEPEATGQTTHRLAAQMISQGHEVWITTPGQLSYESDDRISAFARTVPSAAYGSSGRFLEALKGRAAIRRTITIDQLDLLFLRSNPSAQSPWSQSSGIAFGRVAQKRGVIVLNDPDGLARAANKMYLQTFPPEVRPRTLITRRPGKIKRFFEKEGTIVLKPLQGSGGRGVFILRPSDAPNFGEIIRAVSRDGYVIAQEYLPAAAEGDTRLFLLNGEPLRHEGKYCAFRRVRTGGDMRSNIHAGGKLRRARLDDTAFRIADIVRPRLVEDGMFLVGLDIVGDKLMEINVFSPGGIGSAQLFEKVDFSEAIIQALERKVHYMTHYRRKFSNVEMATL